jgi:hypothetical protein
VDGEHAEQRRGDAEAHEAGHEHPRRARDVPAASARGDPLDRGDDPQQRQDVAVRRERHRRVDERAARDVDRRDERAEREQEERVAEVRPERGVATPDPGAHQAERDEDEDPDEHREDERRRDEPADAGEQQRADPHPQQVIERGGDRDRIPLADVADEQHLARGGRWRQRPERRQLPGVPRPHGQGEQGDGAERRGDRDPRRAGPLPAEADVPAQPVPQPHGAEHGEHEHAVVA